MLAYSATFMIDKAFLKSQRHKHETFWYQMLYKIVNNTSNVSFLINALQDATSNSLFLINLYDTAQRPTPTRSFPWHRYFCSYTYLIIATSTLHRITYTHNSSLGSMLHFRLWNPMQSSGSHLFTIKYPFINPPS